MSDKKDVTSFPPNDDASSPSVSSNGTDIGGIFGSKLGDESTPVMDSKEAQKLYAEAIHDQRRALRRLGPAPSDFERLIDLIYEWRVHASPHLGLTDLMRELLGRNHTASDAQTIQKMINIIKEARTLKIQQALDRLGLDEAERLLGLKEER